MTTRKEPDALFGRLVFLYVGLWIAFRFIQWVIGGCKGPFIGPDRSGRGPGTSFVRNHEANLRKRREQDGPESK